MGDLSTSPSTARAAVIGASGGIGRSLCQLLARSGAFDTVYALSRTATGIDHPRIRTDKLDLLNEDSIEQAAARTGADGPLDLVIVATGLLHQGKLQPEKSLRDLDPINLLESYRVNTVGPAMIAKHFLPLMPRRGKSVFAALSARVGSIDDNRLGGWASYRASKAALNMLMKTLSIEQARRRPDSVVVTLHPGTVATGLSEPFSSRTPADNIFETDISAGHLLHVIDGLGPDDNGGFFAWDGSRIPW